MRFLTPRLRTKQMAVLCRSLATAYRGGIPLLRCLELAAGGRKPRRVVHALTPVIDAIRAGATLDEAVRGEADQFPGEFVEVMALGEQSGSLDAVLKDLAEHYEELLRAKRAIIQQLTYPLCVIIAAVVVIPYLQGAVLFDGTIGAYTLRFAMGWVPFVQKLLLAFVVYRIATRLQILRPFFDGARLFVWPLGQIKRRFALARFFRSLSLLLQGGLPVVACVRRAAAATTNQVMERDLLRAVPPVQEGASLSEALSRCRFVTPAAQRMIAMGERSGKLEETLAKTSALLLAEARHPLWVIISLLEALAILGIGGMVLWQTGRCGIRCLFRCVFR